MIMPLAPQLISDQNCSKKVTEADMIEIEEDLSDL